MFGYTNLSVGGFPQAATLVVIAAIGAASGSASVAAVGSTGGGGAGSASGVATVAATGAWTAAAAGSSVGRAVTVDATGAPIVEAVGSAAGVAVATGLPSREWTELTPNALPGSYYRIEDKSIPGFKTWLVTDFAYVSATIGDVTDFIFDIPEVAYFTSSEAASFGGVSFLSAGTSTVTGVGAPIFAGVGSAGGTAVVNGAGSNVTTIESSGTAAGTCVGDFRSVGDLLGLGVGSAVGLAVADAASSPIVAAVGVSASTSSVISVPLAIYAAVASSDGTSTVDGTCAEASVATSAGVATVIGVGGRTVASVMSAQGTSTADAEGDTLTDFVTSVHHIKCHLLRREITTFVTRREVRLIG